VVNLRLTILTINSDYPACRFKPVVGRYNGNILFSVGKVQRKPAVGEPHQVFSVVFLCPIANAWLIPKFLVALLLPMPPSRRCQFPVSGNPPTPSNYCPVERLRLPHSVQLISFSFVPQSIFRHFPTLYPNSSVPLPEERAGTARELSKESVLVVISRQIIMCCVERDSSAGIAACYGLGGPGIESRCG
jgi:hypothetical protein